MTSALRPGSRHLPSLGRGLSWPGTPAALVVVAGLAVSAGLSGLTALGSPLPTLLALGSLLLALVVTRLRAALVTALLLGATVFPFGTFRFGVAGVRSDLVEAIALLSIATWAGLLVSGRLPAPRFARGIGLLLAATAVGLLVGYLNGADRETLLGQGKQFALYALPLVFTSAFHTSAQQDALERWLLRLCDVGSAYALLAATTGHALNSGLRTSEVATLGATAAAQRIRLPLLALLVIALLLVLARALDQGIGAGAVARLSLYSLAVVLSFNRSTWAPLVLAVVLLVALRRGPRKSGRGVRTVLALSVGGAALFLSASSGGLGTTAQAAAQRAASTLNPKVTSEDSYLDRQDETRSALATLRTSPVLGVGIGPPYGARRATYLPDPPRLVYYDREFIHNTYLGVWLRLGLLGLLGLAVLGWAVTVETTRALRSLPPAVGSRHLAAALSLLVVALSALLQTALTDQATTLGICAALALVQRPRLSPARAAARPPRSPHPASSS